MVWKTIDLLLNLFEFCVDPKRSASPMCVPQRNRNLQCWDLDKSLNPKKQSSKGSPVPNKANEYGYSQTDQGIVWCKSFQSPRRIIWCRIGCDSVVSKLLTRHGRIKPNRNFIGNNICKANALGAMKIHQSTFQFRRQHVFGQCGF